MKKIVFGFVLFLFCSAYSQRSAITPIWRLMLTSNVIVTGKVLSHDTTCSVVAIEKILLAPNNLNLLARKKIKINHSNNATLMIKSASILDGSHAVFYLNTIANTDNLNHTDRFSATVPVALNNKIKIINTAHLEDYATIQQYTDAIRFVRKAYFLDKTGMVCSLLSTKKIRKFSEINALSKSIFEEIERERKQYLQ